MHKLKMRNDTFVSANNAAAMYFLRCITIVLWRSPAGTFISLVAFEHVSVAGSRPQSPRTAPAPTQHSYFTAASISTSF